MRKFEVQEIVPVLLSESPVIVDRYLMSPFVWEQDGAHWMALRVVEVTVDKGWGESIIRFAKGDGTNFELAETPALAPGPWAEDLGGCEDPSVFFHEGQCKVYYTGWNAHIRQSKLLFAAGPDIAHLRKRGDVLHGFKHWNTKEASLVKTPFGWRLFFEYSDAEHSLIGRAFSSEPGEHWKEETDPFGLRPDSWDSWHLSTGPVVFHQTDRPVMFYNGSDQGVHWRIGWVEFDAAYQNITARGEEPVIRPEHLPDGYNDIAFAASALERDEQHLDIYYSVGDRSLFRARIEVKNSL